MVCCANFCICDLAAWICAGLLPSCFILPSNVCHAIDASFNSPAIATAPVFNTSKLLLIAELARLAPSIDLKSPLALLVPSLKTPPFPLNLFLSLLNPLCADSKPDLSLLSGPLKASLILIVAEIVAISYPPSI